MHISYKIVFCTVLLCSIFARPAENVPILLHDPLCKSMQATGAELSKAYVTGSIKLSGQYSLVQLQQMVELMGKKLGNQQNNAELRVSDYQELAYLSFNQSNSQTVLYAKKIQDTLKPTNNIEITIRIIEDNPTEISILKNQARINEILREKNTEPIISTCLEGYLDGKLRKDEWEYCIRDAFAVIDAKLLTQITNPQYASSTGWSPLLNNSLQVGKDSVNINMAIRYHGFDRRTYITIGSPIISIEY